MFSNKTQEGCKFCSIFSKFVVLTKAFQYIIGSTLESRSLMLSVAGIGRASLLIIIIILLVWLIRVESSRWSNKIGKKNSGAFVYRHT